MIKKRGFRQKSGRSQSPVFGPSIPVVNRMKIGLRKGWFFIGKQVVGEFVTKTVLLRKPYSLLWKWTVVSGFFNFFILFTMGLGQKKCSFFWKFWKNAFSGCFFDPKFILFWTGLGYRFRDPFFDPFWTSKTTKNDRFLTPVSERENIAKRPGRAIFFFDFFKKIKKNEKSRFFDFRPVFILFTTGIEGPKTRFPRVPGSNFPWFP